MRGARFTVPCLLLLLTLGACGTSLKPMPEVGEVIVRARGGDGKALALLVRYFESPVEEESLQAYTALIEVGEPAVPHLLRALEDDSRATVEAAAGALGNIKDPRAVAPLIEALGRPGFPRTVGIWALGEIGAPEAVPVLVEALGDDDPEVRKYAARSLVKYRERAVPEAIAALDSPRAEARHYAARVLGQSGDARAVKPILERFSALDAEVAVWALGKLGAREALPLIEERLADPDWRIRLAAVQSLGMLADSRSIPALRRMLDDGEWVVREWAARGLEEITLERQLYRDQYGSMVVPYNLYR